MQQTAGIIQESVEENGGSGRFVCQGELLCGISTLPLFYQVRNYYPAWVTRSGVLSSADEFIEAIAQAKDHGLDSGAYHAGIVKDLLKTARQGFENGQSPAPKLLADLDLLLTDAYLMLASHLRAGRVNAESLHSQWIPHSPHADLARILSMGLKNGSVRDSLFTLLPPHENYRKLTEALSRYREIARQGGWPKIPSGKMLEIGSSGTRVLLLRQHLEKTGDLQKSDSVNQWKFDTNLDIAVKQYQKRHRLRIDGVVGPNTLAELNVSVEERIDQIMINLERWRWIPHDLGDPYILVNIAGFFLRAFDKGKPVLDMKVVVGRPYRKTPVFSSTMTYLVFNPYWNVPRNLVVKDILPKLTDDVSYLINKDIRVYSGWQKNAVSIDPATIDWQKYSKDNLPFRFRQEPGPKNALGSVKFMFPNKFSVYLHDTPAKNLFDKVRRGFSSGCIRVQDPLSLAEFVLAHSPNWDEKTIASQIATGERKVVSLDKKVKVHLVYFTAWVDENGDINFLRDIYKRDKRLKMALEENPPGV